MAVQPENESTVPKQNLHPTIQPANLLKGWLWQVKPKGKSRFPLKTGTIVPRFIELSKSLHGNSQRFQFWTVAKLWPKAVTNMWIFLVTQQHRHDMQLLDTHLYASNVARQPLCNLPFCRSQRNQWLSSNASPQWFTLPIKLVHVGYMFYLYCLRLYFCFWIVF